MPAMPRPGTGDSRRILSIDVVRGLVILAMLFVNDIASVRGTPSWMRHMPTHQDGMTFVDLVFPAFLFIVGMALPFSIGNRLRRGDSAKQVWGHILKRTAGLLAIGFFMVNGDEIATNGPLHPAWWHALMYGGVLLVWNQYPKAEAAKGRWPVWLRASGFLMLATAACLYRGAAHPAFFAMRPLWWGILGLIGWAFLVACLFYIPLRRNPAGILGAAALLLCFFMAEQAGLFARIFPALSSLRLGYILGSHGAIVLAGCLLGMMLDPENGITGHSRRARWAFLYCLGLYAASILLHALRPLHEMFIISKNLGTPVWCLRSCALTGFIWLVVYWLVDAPHWRRNTGFLERAGGNALFAYVLAPIAYTIFDLSALPLRGWHFFQALDSVFWLGLIRAVLFALAVTWLAGLLKERGINLKV